jgi:hypothetical protein
VRRLAANFSPVPLIAPPPLGRLIESALIEKSDDLVVSFLPWHEEIPGADPGFSFADI